MGGDRFSLADRVAVVCGGGRGIGRSIALALADAGADVVVVSRTAEQIEQVAGEIRAHGRKALAVCADVSSPEDIERLVTATMNTFRHIDVLVSNAGISPWYVRAEKTTPEMWDSLMAVNLRGLFFCCKAVGKVMLEQKRGSIINMASTGGLIGVPRLVAYNASKAGVIEVTKTLAVEWAARNVRVNTIAPHYVVTDLIRGMVGNPGLLQTMVAAVPLGRLAEPDEVAGAAVYLASDASSFVTGATLVIDGGATVA